MNAPFNVAQAVTTGQSTAQAVRLTKPANGQAISLQLDANTRLDFSGIASDQITLVRVGNQLVILFDNQATLTLAPFFDANGNPIGGLAIDLGSRIVDGQEFAGLFPVTTDQSILPASGSAGGGGDGFGAGDPSVDALNTGNPLDLLGNEDGTPITFSINEILARDNGEEEPVEPAPTAFSQTIGMDEDGDGFFPAPNNLPDFLPDGPGDDPTAPLSFFGGPGISGNPAPLGPAFFNFGPDGPAALNAIVYDIAALDALGITSGGQPVEWFSDGNNGLLGMLGNETLVIRLTILDLDTGDYRVDIYRPLDHSAPSDGLAFENELPIPINFTLTDGNGTTATGTLTVSVDDDSPDPCNPLLGNVEETGAVVQVPPIDLDLAWGADNFNGNQGPIDRKIEFANNTTPGANVVARDVNGAPLLDGNGDPLALTSNGDPILYTIIPPAVQGGLVYLVAYTELSPGIVPTKIDDPNVVFWASLSDQALGIAGFELRGVLDHAAAPMIDPSTGDYVHAMDLNFLFNAFDSDGDGVSGGFSVRVDAAGTVAPSPCGCWLEVDYSSLAGGVFINLSDSSRTVGTETADARTAQDRDGVTPPVIGIDQLGTDVLDAIGTDSADIIIGGDEDNLLDGQGGDDLIRGGGGDDVIYGGAGEDTIRGGRGDDAILGEGGADTIYGGSGWDEIHGGAGADWISGGAGSDFLTGDGGADTIYGGSGDDLIQAGAGADWVQGGRGDDIINGEGGADTLRGGRGDDQIYGGAGADWLYGGRGDDYIEGNGDDDTIIYNVGDGSDVVYGGGGDDVQEIYGTGDSETFNVNRITLFGDNFVGINIQDGIAFPAPATSGNFEVATRVEDIYIDTGAGPDAVVVTGSLGGTTLATSTITIDGGSDNATDVVDASGLTSNHGIVFIGGGGDDYFFLSGADGVDTFEGGTGIDTALYACQSTDATFGFDGTYWTVTVNGVTDTIIGVETVEFADESFLLVDHYGTDVGGFQTIQDAVDYSCGCQTILIAPGTYDENVLIADKDVSLKGFGNGQTFITGQITISGVLDGDLAIRDLSIDAAGENYGVFANASSTGFAGEITIENVIIENAGRNGFAYIRDGNGTTPTLADTIGAISIVNSEFAGNGGAAGATRGDILIYGFNGDLTIDTVSIHDAAAGADKAIQVRGVQDASDVTNVGPFASFGDVTITNLDITGTYSQDLVAFYRIADFAQFVATNVSLNANAPWGLFNLDEAGGNVDLSGVTGTNGAGPFIATMQGLASGDVFTGTDGNDMFVGRGGGDNLAGGAGNDTFFYTAGGGRDIVDGGTETTRDLLDVTGASGTENFFIETPAEYNARVNPDYAGAAEFLVSNGSQILAEVTEIEDVVIHGNGGADTLTVSGSFTGTSLLTSTITFDGTGDNNGDIVDARRLTSGHSIVFNGGGGNDFFMVGTGGGNHTFNAGAGSDTIDYSAYAPASPTGVTVDLQIATAQATGNGDATLTGVENVIGSARNDTLTGDANANTLDGGEGDDLITGGGGNDWLLGGSGDDTFSYVIGDGVDAIDGGDLDFVGDRLIAVTSDFADYIRIAPNLDGDGRLDIDIDGNSLVENTADGIELDITKVEHIDIETEEGNDNVVISGNLASTGVQTVSIDLGEGNDTVTIAPTTGTPASVSVQGDAGNDTVDASAREFRPAIGQDFLVSTTNANSQSTPQITALANGGFAVTWYSNDNGANYDIRGRVFAADGTPVNGSDFLVSTSNARDQFSPQITALANGGFAVTWHSFDNGANFDIRGQVFAADGTPIDGSDFLVSTTNANGQIVPQITALANGGFAVTWYSNDNGPDYDIRGQVFAADGTPIDGSDFLVSTTNANNQQNPEITALENGGFAVTWYSRDNGANFDIRGQVFAADGTPIDGSDFLVSTTNANDQFSPQITALANGGFAVTWPSDSGANFDIRGQVFAADGTPIDGSDFLVSTTNAREQVNPQITALANGGFAVTWHSSDNGANNDIRGQVFAADGTPIGGSDFLVSTTNANNQQNPQITALANGGFAVSWQSGSDIYGRVFDQYGVESAVTFDGGAGNDVFRSGAGNDIFLGGDDNDTAFYRVGDGRDTVNGGTESGGGVDLLDVTGTAAGENFFIETVADYNTRVGPDYAGPAEILVSSGEQILVEADEIEDIVIHGGGGADTLTVSGSFTGTSLLTSTITYDSGEGNDTLDLRNRDSNHRVVSDGGNGTDTVIYDFTRASVTSITQIFDTDGVTVIGANITHNEGGQPVTDVLKNFESFVFDGVTFDLTTVFNQPPNAVDDILLGGLEDFPLTIPVAGLIAGDTDPENDPFTIISVQDAVNGTVSLSGGNVIFNPTANYFGPASFTYTIQDSFGGTDTATVSFLGFLSVNDLPTVDLDADDSTIDGDGSIVTFTIGGPAIQLTDTDVSIADVDDAFMQRASISLNNAETGDVLGVTGSLPNGISIQGQSATSIVLTGVASRADYEAAIEAITFSSSSASTAQRSASVVVTDSSGTILLASSSTALININSAPSITSVQNGDITEDANAVPGGPNLVVNPDLNQSDSFVWAPWSTIPGVSPTSSGHTGDAVIISAGGSLTQSFNTIAGAVYQIEYWHFPFHTGIAFQVSWNGSVVQTVTGQSPTGFAPYTVEVVGTGGPVNLKLGVAAGSPNGGELDDVSLRLLSPPAQQATSGFLSYNDPDGVGVPTASVAAQGTGYVGTFSFGAIDGNSVEWNFAADNSALQFLRANQTVTQTYAVTLTDNHGASTTQNVAVQLHGVNDAVTITTNNGDPLAVSVTENQTAVTTIAASDVDVGDAFTWTLSGTDVALFDISNTGVLTFKNAPDFESPSDSGNNNVYDLIVQVSDGTVTDTQAVAVTVTNGNEAPVFTSAAQTSSVIEDANGTFGTNLVLNQAFETYTLTPQLAFQNWNGSVSGVTLESAGHTGNAVQLGQNASVSQTFNTVAGQLYQLDYWAHANNPADWLRVSVDGSLVQTAFGPADYSPYTLQFFADDSTTELKFVGDIVSGPSGGIDLDDVTLRQVVPPAQQTTNGIITFTDEAADTHSAAFAAQGAGYLGTFSLTGVNQGADSVSWNFAVSNSSLQSLRANETRTQTYAITVSDNNGNSAIQNVSVELRGVNDAPVITTNNGLPLALTLNEGTNAANFFLATDADVGGPALTWSLAGADAGRFTLTNNSLTFASTPNFEQPLDAGGNNVYDLIVRVSDGTATDSQFVTVTVTNVNEAPSGFDRTVGLFEDVTYTFSASDFPLTDIDGNQLGGIVIGTPVSGGKLLYANAAVSAGNFISAADIASGMLTFAPNDDAFNVTTSFTFQVVDNGPTGGAHRNTDPSANTMTLVVSNANYADNQYFAPGATTVSVENPYGNASFSDGGGGGTDVFRWLQGVGAGGGRFFDLDMQRSDDNLEIQYSSNVGFGVLTILGQFSPGFGGMESIEFNPGMAFGTANISGVYDLGEANNAGSGTTSRDFLIGSAANDTRNGFNGDDVIFGGGGNDTLLGGFDNDILAGGLGNDDLWGESGNDLLVGGLGNDTLRGGSGADTHRFADTGADDRDTILDYSLTDGDKLDLSALLDANFGNGSQEGHFVKLVQSGGNTTVQVDTNGPVGGFNYVDVAVLQGYTGSVKAVFENVEHTLTA